jgi:hypothetical protein
VNTDNIEKGTVCGKIPQGSKILYLRKYNAQTAHCQCKINIKMAKDNAQTRIVFSHFYISHVFPYRRYLKPLKCRIACHKACMDIAVIITMSFAVALWAKLKQPEQKR